ncbi:glycoside hydrolase superfamily [Aspergillus heterothallicus]
MSGVCSYIQVQADDGCWALADRCGISQDTLTEYNTVDDFCNTLVVDQYVCCSEGSLPDFSPKPDDDGNCYVYIIQPDDTCDDIAKANKMESDKIDDYNSLTWGYMGCNSLQKYQAICLSEGLPPFPEPVDGNVCGPQVPGTEQPNNGSTWDWAELNPCPLNACCDIWGQCGITPEFCTNTTEPGGAPGTAKNETNGCISNCGTDIISTDVYRPFPLRIGYFENWNLNRPCANMDISKMTEDGYYTHVHWAFGNITESWEVDVSGAQEQFDGLLKLENIERIISFGGWGFSTDTYTHNIFRTGVRDGNRQTLAANVVNFVVDNDLDGVDFDWEYPGAQDIPGIDPDNLDSGENYAEFLKLVRSQLPSEKSMSMALPASYWYLKGFDPLTQFDDYIDYYVYMTYDLHGQWDYNNTFVNPGCELGNCLRSHVNKTETEYTLAMITKAGIPSIKVVPGLALYGRSFEMTDPECQGPECTFTGKESGATKGACTDTAGYLSNIEIWSLISQANSEDNSDDITITQYEDEGDILIYDSNQWVSWLTPDSYKARQQWYDDLHFGGSVDWAVDLNRTYSNNGTGDLEDSGDDWPAWEPCPSITFPYLEGLQTAQEAGAIPDHCVAQMTLDTLMWMLDTAYDNYTDVNNGYDEMFEYYVKYIEKVVPSVLENAFMWNMSITGSNQLVPEIGPGFNYFDCQFPEQDEVVPCAANWEDNLDPLIRYVDATDLTISDKDGLATALANAGLLEDWVDFGDYSIHRTNYGTLPAVHWTLSFTGWPIKNESMVVQNPKDIVTTALPNIPGMRSDMQTTLLEIMGGGWMGGDARDAALAYAPAVFMLQQAVDSMAQAKQLGQEEEEEEEEEERKRKENFILLIISVVFMFVPMVGEGIAAGLGLANLARIIAVAGELANAALATYDTVQDPASAVVNMLGLLFGVGSIAKASRNAKGLSEVANWRKGMKAGEITSLGKIFENGDTMVQSILGKVCKI